MRARESLADVVGYAVDSTFTVGLTPGTTVNGVEFEGCVVTNAAMAQARLLGCTFAGCRFESVDLSMAELVDSRFTGCTFTGCRLLGLQWASLSMENLVSPNRFHECQLDLANFSGCDLPGTSFLQCRLREADFAGADLRKADFCGSDLEGARFAQTDLREARLIGAVGWSVDPVTNHVRGLQVDFTGVLGLLTPMGVQVAVPALADQ